MKLRKLAAEKGLIYGTAISAASIASDPEFIDLVLQQAGAVVAENDMKWQTLNRGKPGDDDYGPADTVAAFALESGLVLRGHNLLWYRSTPRWFFNLRTNRQKEGAIVSHIRNLAGRYRGKVHSWDVVNEPIEPENGRADGLRTAVFLDKMGPDYIDLAHHAAREADPTARLVVNEIRCRARRAGTRGAPRRASQSAAANAAIRDSGRRRRHSSASSMRRRTAVFGFPLAPVSRRDSGPRLDDPDHRTRRHRQRCAC
jgi:GH35 family endo-1,4-beta-xylanase